MSILFEFYVTPNPSEESKDQRYHPRVIGNHTVSSDRIAEEVHRRSALTKGDVRSALSNLSDVIGRCLCEGNRVHLEGLGYFQVTLAANTEVNPKKTRSQSVYIKSVRFRPDKALLSKFNGVKLERSDYKPHSSAVTNEEIDKQLTRYFKKNDVLIRKSFQYLFGMTRITAIRHLNRLKAEGKIINQGMRLHPLYKPAPGYYGTPGEPE